MLMLFLWTEFTIFFNPQHSLQFAPSSRAVTASVAAACDLEYAGSLKISHSNQVATRGSHPSN